MTTFPTTIPELVVHLIGATIGSGLMIYQTYLIYQIRKILKNTAGASGLSRWHDQPAGSDGIILCRAG